MSVEHKISLPKLDWNIRGQKLAIVGYSHHTDGTEQIDFTQELVSDVSDGKRIAFFTRISSYFGLTNEQFWPHVLFFNFVPVRIGDRTDKYKVAPREQHERGQQKVRRVLLENKPDRILVFSTKAWNHFPNTDDEDAGRSCSSLFKSPHENWYRAEIGTYTVEGRRILACGFRHPERANSNQMKQAVETFMNLP